MRLLLAIVLLIIPAGIAFAGAWTQGEGQGIFIASANYYSASHLFDNGGQNRPQPNYQKYEFSPYGEYGLRDWLTLGGSTSLQRDMQSTTQHTSLGDTELFARTRLWQGSGFVVSAAPLVKLSSPSSPQRNPVIGSSHPDAGLTLSGGYGFNLFGQHHFAAIDTGYRYRFGAPHDQVRLDATLGIGITHELTLLPQLFQTYRTSAPTAATFTQSSGDDYDLTTLQLSAVYALREDVSLQAGGFSNLTGKNVGRGDGVLIALWKRF